VTVAFFFHCCKSFRVRFSFSHHIRRITN